MLKQLSLAFGVSALAISGVSAAPVSLNYWMWDPPQKAAYQLCADAFTKLHPDITVNISQFGWGDYWTGLTTAFVAGNAPDVFVNNVSRFPEFLGNGQLTDLTPLAEKDMVDTSVYRPGLVALWSGQDGHLYGMPKDWDTIAIVYNADAAEKAGVTKDEMDNLTWNPDDGGTFQQVTAKLTLDNKGRNGLDKNFDKSNVVRYGFVNNRFEGIGQVGWSPLAYSLGFKHLGTPWGSDWNYNDPKLAQTFQWLRGIAQEKIAIPESELGDLGAIALVTAEKGALAFAGDWQINSYVKGAKFKLGYAPLPKGPLGRKSNLNGIADAIWTGTKHPEEAWKWVKFLGSSDCQDLIGGTGVVFPSIPSATDISVKVHQEQGVDVQPWLTVATEDQTFLYPVTDHGSEVLSIINPAIDQIFLGNDDIAAILKDANDKIKALY